MKELRKRFLAATGMIFLVVLFGTAGYMGIEGWNFWDSFYMTVITRTTVGYREIHEMSFAGQVFTVVLLIGGVGTVLYALSTGAKVLLEGELREIYGRKRVEKKLKELRDHFIICGYGRMWRVIARELEHERLRYVVIEKNEVLLDADQKDELLVAQGDATNDDLLKRVRIESAQCLISVLPTDAENLYVVLRARGLNPKLLIVARAGEEGSEQKSVAASRGWRKSDPTAGGSPFTRNCAAYPGTSFRSGSFAAVFVCWPTVAGAPSRRSRWRPPGLGAAAASRPSAG